MNMLAVSVLLIVIISIVAFIASFLAFDQLVSYEFKSHRAQWESDGKPRGFFWSPRGYWRAQIANGRNVGQVKSESSRAYQKIILAWMFSTPQWTEKDETAGRLIKRFRLLSFIGNGGLIVCFILLLTNALRQ